MILVNILFKSNCTFARMTEEQIEAAIQQGWKKETKSIDKEQLIVLIKD